LNSEQGKAVSSAVEPFHGRKIGKGSSNPFDACNRLGWINKIICMPRPPQKLNKADARFNHKQMRPAQGSKNKSGKPPTNPPKKEKTLWKRQQKQQQPAARTLQGSRSPYSRPENHLKFTQKHGNPQLWTMTKCYTLYPLLIFEK